MEEKQGLREMRTRTYVIVWVALVVLTGVTVSLAGRSMGAGQSCSRF